MLNAECCQYTSDNISDQRLSLLTFPETKQGAFFLERWTQDFPVLDDKSTKAVVLLDYSQKVSHRRATLASGDGQEMKKGGDDVMKRA